MGTHNVMGSLEDLSPRYLNVLVFKHFFGKKLRLDLDSLSPLIYHMKKYQNVKTVTLSGNKTHLSGDYTQTLQVNTALSSTTSPEICSCSQGKLH